MISAMQALSKTNLAETAIEAIRGDILAQALGGRRQAAERGDAVRHAVGQPRHGARGGARARLAGLLETRQGSGTYVLLDHRYQPAADDGAAREPA